MIGADRRHERKLDGETIGDGDDCERTEACKGDDQSGGGGADDDARAA